jgi:hypothetical protein
MQTTCQMRGCRSKAKSGTFCSDHAFQELRTRLGVLDQRSGVNVSSHRELRDEAARLGITLAEMVPVVARAAAARKVRSPVA